MDFVSADRSGDSEFQARLKDYNFGVAETNRQITVDIQNDRTTEKQQDSDIDNTELFTQIKDATGQAGNVASATATFKNIQQYGAKIQDGIKEATKTATATAEKIQQSLPTTETPLEQLGGKVGAEAEAGGGLLGKVGTKALKGLGVVGAVAGMGMAIASDENGGWAKMSTADKLGNVAEIGGAGLDMVGVGLEATGIGVPIGLALQGFGTLLQIGSGLESAISSKEAEAPAKQQAQQQEQQAEASEQKPLQEEVGVSESQAGGLGVARQQQ
jgi:hypothetical protein